MGGQSQARRGGLAVWWGAVVGVITLTTGAAAAPTNLAAATGPGRGSDRSALFPPHSTVVLLSGLPGDVESENDYHRQLETWLELIAADGPGHQVLVLCDQPESVSLPGKLQGKVLKADRATFLGLEPELAARTNSLDVIAWGHGGRQGSLPVFHVRGPRLTAADFKTLAAKAPADSRWVLIFRGSGAFAGELARPGRQVIASEADTMFASDPVGMGLLLSLAREQPELSFTAMAEQLGRATAAWYKERNLAQTEQPTLWVGTEKPRLLAPAEEAVGGDAGKPTETAAAQVDPGNPERGAPEPLSTNLPPAWQAIKRVDPTQYPGAEGVILRQRLSYTLGSSPAMTTEQEQFIQILTPEGKRFGDFDVPYSPPFEDISFEDCEVLGPDGRLRRLDPDAIREARPPSMGDYESGSRKFFSLPGVVPGSVLHVRYRTVWEKFPLPQISLKIPAGDQLPVVVTAIEVSVPKESAFHFALEGVTAPDPAIRQATYGTTYSWHLENLPAEQHEILAPPGQGRHLLVSTFADWAAFAEWYGRVSKLTDEVTPAIAAKAAELTRGATNDRAQVLAVYNYVTALRYVAVPLGVNSYRPHAAANVLENQFGDCKDKANLFNALLHALHLEASLVLVPRFSQAYDDLPGLAFNHAISRVRLEGQTLWVDTTDDVCRFGLLPPGDPGRKVLVVDGKTTQLTQLPPPDLQQHQLKITGALTCTGPTDAWPVTWNALARGYPDYELRAAARDAGEHHSALPLLAARFRPAAGVFALDTQHATAVSALDEDFHWQAEGSCVGISTPEGKSCRLRAPFWLPREWELALNRRKAALFLNQGYPLTLDEDIQFTLPAQAEPSTLPGVVESSAEPLRWRIEWKPAGDHKLSAQLHAELVRGELAPAETPMLQQQVRQLWSALAASAIVSLPASNP